MTRASGSLPARFRDCVSPETRYFTAPGRYLLESGAVLDGLTVAYRTWGDPANARDRAVLICHALTGSADVDAWWPDVIGSDGAFDPATDFIVCSNLLGSCYGTSGPASLRPPGDRPWRSAFPRITVRDMVAVQRLLIDHLGIERLAIVTGPSLGGMQALEWALMYPERVGSIVPIGVGGRHSPWCIGISEAQRQAIYADPNWQDGDYTDDAPPERGLAAARMMAICTYRSADSFGRRFGRDRAADGGFEMQRYLRYQGDKINRRFDANAYVRLTQAMNGHDVARGRGAYETALGRVGQPALVVSISSDLLYPPAEQAELARLLPNARHETLHSDEGHDGFLIATRQLAGMIRQFRDESVDSRAAA